MFNVHRTDTLQIHSTARALGTDHDTFGRISQAAGEKVIALPVIPAAYPVQTTVEKRQAIPTVRRMNISPIHREHCFVPRIQILLEGSMRADEIGRIRIAVCCTVCYCCLHDPFCQPTMCQKCSIAFLTPKSLLNIVAGPITKLAASKRKRPATQSSPKPCKG